MLVERDRDGRERTLTPEGFDVRSRVHEYGGNCFAVGDDRVFFFNDPDRRVYAQDLEGEARPQAISRSPRSFHESSVGSSQ